MCFPLAQYDQAAGSATAGEGNRSIQSVLAEDPVPFDLLASTFPAALLNTKVPRDLLVEHVSDDAWIHRFRADGYMLRASQFYLCFATASDRRAFGKWVKGTGCRSWKKNGLTIKSLSPEDVASFGWTVRPLSPALRRRVGYRLEDASPSRPTVGELGFGSDADMTPFELGWFPFEYTLQGRMQPPADFVPPRLAAARLSAQTPSEPHSTRTDDATFMPSARHRRTASPAAALNGADSRAAHEDLAFPIKDEEDAEMKPSVEELRRAGELANAVRANTLDPGEVTVPASAPTMLHPPPADPVESESSGPFTPLLSRRESETHVSPGSCDGSMGSNSALVHAVEQQSAPSLLRRVTAIELMDL